MPLLSRYRTALIVLCVVIALYALLGFFAVPYAVKAYGIPAISERLQHPVFLSDISFNPFSLSLTLSGFEIQEPDYTPMLGFEELFVNFEGTSLVRSAFRFDEIRLTLPFGLVHIQPDGRLNWLALVKAAAGKQNVPAEAPATPDTAEPKPLPQVEVRLLSIHQGVLEFRDDSKRKPVRIDVVPIELMLRNFSTRRGVENAYAFTAEFGQGETVGWEGQLHLDPLESSGRIALSQVKLTTFWPSLRDLFQFEILSGTVMVDVRYYFDMKVAPVNAQLFDGKIALSDFRLGAPGNPDPLITIPSLVLDAVHLDLPKRGLGVQTVTMTGADIRTWFAQDGVVNYVPLFAPVAQGDVRETPKPEPVRSWDVGVHKVDISKARIAFEDRRFEPPVAVAIDDLDVTVDDIHVPFKDPMPFTASFHMNAEGTIQGQGSVQMNPLQADLKLSLAQIQLRPFQSYFNSAMPLDVKQGELDLAGEVNYRSRHESEPLLRYTGRLGVKNLVLTGRVSQQEFLGWSALELNNVTLALAPTHVKVGEISLRDPAIRYVTAKDGSTNLAAARPASAPAASQPPASEPTEKPPSKKDAPLPPVAIDQVRLSKLSALFRDESIEPPVTIGLHDLSGTIRGLSSKQLSKANVSLAGKVDKVAPVKIQGQINPLSEDAFTNLKVTFQGVDLTAVSPYAGKYAGYPITKGKLSLDLSYQVSKKKLIGENKVLVDQFTFGEKTQSPDATGLPVRLAVALLKDRRGLIDIDMPVRGDLSEPDFKYGRVVLNALVNVITKVATSPFAALGGLVGGSAEDLQFIEFPVGAETLEPAGLQKIGSIAKALEERPALRVEIIGAADLTRDREALALQKMSAEVQRRFTKGGTKNLQAVLSPEREFEFLSDLYAEKLGKQPTQREEMPEGKSVERVLTVDELRRQLIPGMTVEESELRSLAQRRAKAIREQLIAEGRLPEERVFLVEVELSESEGEKVRARLNLAGN
jgi:uncharacterized protein involved in outer membrane biogenesis